jgi:nicotinate-nucleotide pyrophosphorylase (carboxylating)
MIMDIEELVRHALEEDIGSGDVTTAATVDSHIQGRAILLAKSDGVLSGLEVFREVFHRFDETVTFHPSYHDGESFVNGAVIGVLQGPLASILSAERTALNFLGRLSGIATLTRRYVDRVRDTQAVILDTRKTTPLLRSLEKAAVVHGGGSNHRFGLYDMVLVKDNHEAAAGGISNALKRLKSSMKKNLKIEVEVQTLEQIEEVLPFEVDRILLDNFNLDMVVAAVERVGGKVPLEVSGNVTLDNVREIALTGVNFISVGALTHSAPSSDFSLRIKDA